MQFIFTQHWKQKKEERRDITIAAIEFAIMHSTPIRDRHWQNALNAIYRIPPSGRLLKVVYRREGQSIKIITAYWLE